MGMVCRQELELYPLQTRTRSKNRSESGTVPDTVLENNCNRELILDQCGFMNGSKTGIGL